MSVALPSVAADPHDHWARIRAKQPIGYCEQINSWLILAHDEARTILETADSFAVSAYKDLPPSMVQADSSFLLDAESLGVLRSSVPSALSEHLRRYTPIFLARCCDLACELPRTEVELVAAYFMPLAASTRADRLGFRRPALDRILAAFYIADVSGAADSRRASASLATDILMAALVNDRAPGSLTDALWELWQQSGLRSEWLAAFLGPTVLSEVRSSGLQLAIHATAGILSQPEVLATFNTDPPSAALCRSVAAEAARWEPVNQVVPRVAVKDVALAGATIRGGDRILVVLPAVCRDADAHQAPDTFLPSRKERSLAFGSGDRFCLGRELSVSRAAHAVRALWTHNIVEPTDAPSSSVTFGRYFTHLPARVSPRKDAS